MNKPAPDDDDYVRPIYRTSFGEYAIIAVAACCTMAFILMMVLPSPFAKYEKAKAALETSEKALAAPIPGGEVSVDISSAARK